MNCYEWQHQIKLSGMSITADCSYEVENPDNPETPITITISGSSTWPDVEPPYTRRGMRCGVGYDSFYAKRANWTGWERFFIIAGVQAEVTYPIEIVSSETGVIGMAGIFGSAVEGIAQFVSGVYKPEDTSDPFYACGFGVWSKSTEVTKGAVFIYSDSNELLATGFYDQIEPGAEITYYRPYEFETPIGTGTINYTLTIL